MGYLGVDTHRPLEIWVWSLGETQGLERLTSVILWVGHTGVDPQRTVREEGTLSWVSGSDQA